MLIKQSMTSHPWSIPLPSTLHETLDLQFINQFDEIIVFGDIHGCYDEMMECIEKVGTNSKVLKLFVGDLVNKGEKSKQVIEYFRNNSQSCFAVRGNHDEVVIRNLQSKKKNLSEDDQWMKNLTADEVDFLKSLPYTIKIPDLNIIIVHAGLVPKLDLNKNKPYDMVNMRNLIPNLTNDIFEPTKEDDKGEPWAKLWPGPEHVYFGHDAKRMLQEYPFATGLDTGCVYGKYLTGVFVKGQRKGDYVTAKAKKMYREPGTKG